MLIVHFVHAMWKLTVQPYRLMWIGDVAGDLAPKLASGVVDKSWSYTWHFLLRMKGCHVAQPGAATWHPLVVV
jgi:hypothetical protein